MSLFVRGARVVPGDGSAPLPRASLRIEGDRIEAIGRSLEPAPGDMVIDAGGRVVMPGFVDAHTHAMFAGDRRDELRRLQSGDACHEHRPAGHRGERRARAGRDVPRGAEERIDDRARRCRVQAVLQRNLGDPGIAEVLRDHECGDRDTGRHVTAQVPPVVARKPVEHRQHPGRLHRADRSR